MEVWYVGIFEFATKAQIFISMEKNGPILYSQLTLAETIPSPCKFRGHSSVT
jgi:hypothetical protein